MPGMLDGLRVVELGGRLAAPLAAMMLADHGAEVVQVPIPGCPQDSALRAILGRGKSALSLDLDSAGGRTDLLDLLSAADVVVTDLSAQEMASLGVDFASIRTSFNPGLVSCVIPSFPTDDPRNALPHFESVPAAAGCLYERMIGAPRFHDFPVPSVLASLFSASGIVAALYARLSSGLGQQVESNLFGSALFAQILVVFMKTGVPRGFVPLKLVATPFMRAWKCRDGRYAYLHITLPAHNARMIEMLEGSGLEKHARKLRSVLSADTVRDPSQVGSIGEARRIIRALEQTFLERTADEWEATLGKDLCCIKVRTVDEWLHDSMKAGMVDAVSVEDPELGPILAPGPGVVSQEAPARPGPRRFLDDVGRLVERWKAAGAPTSEGAGTAEVRTTAATPTTAPSTEPVRESGARGGTPPLAGVKVADLSRIIAGPCAARLLAELGAEVTSIQSPGGLDWALSFHLLFNPGKRSAAIDMSAPEGRMTLQRLLAELEPDVLIHNYRHLDVARGIGLGPDQVREAFPKIVYTHLNAYGNAGEWQNRPGFEQVVQAVSGIQMSYGSGGKPRLLPTPVIDIGSGLAGAFAALLGLYNRRRTGRGAFVTTHLTWVSVVFQILQLASLQRAPGDVRTAQADAVAGLVRVRGGHALLAGPRADVSSWLQTLGIGPGKDLVGGVGRSLATRSLTHWQKRLKESGLESTVALISCQKARKLLAEHPRISSGAVPLLSRRSYPGSPIPLAYLSSPLSLDRNPLRLVEPPPLRGADTRELLARIGILVPEGAGVSPYPKDKPYLIWLVSLVRWGLFAWRSGSV